ncbi:MAG: hypothetical protein IJU02_07385 [Lachnospiraceae bacterium]|nr:hypothetical protein [Lachnospiraceae bacterium]
MLKGVKIQEAINSVLKKDLVGKSVIEEDTYILSSTTKELIANVILESEKKAMDNDTFLTNLAKKMQEEYPKGRKEGTNYMWRGTIVEIVRKLKTLIGRYNITFTEEQAINATREYVKSFNGNYTKMRLLKYFILKAERDADGNINLTSDFMALIENEGQGDNKDWTTNLI